jgi:hypothetical protein
MPCAQLLEADSDIDIAAPGKSRLQLPAPFDKYDNQ